LTDSGRAVQVNYNFSIYGDIMEFVERILAKVVGEELSQKEVEEVSGARLDWCSSVGGYATYDITTGAADCDLS
jgi:hypothetical protein